jgi:hypothetical protein
MAYFCDTQFLLIAAFFACGLHGVRFSGQHRGHTPQFPPSLMDTQTTGTSTEETQTGDSSTGTIDETTTGDTSETGAHEDADTLRKQLSDKDRYIKQLESERIDVSPKKKAPKSEAVTEDQDDVMAWMTLNSDSLKLVGKEWQEELSFYKSHDIKVTNEIRDRALRDANNRKGIGPKNTAEADRQASTSSESTGEMRKTNSREIPESVKAHVPKMTPEQYAKYKAEFEASKKRS